MGKEIVEKKIGRMTYGKLVQKHQPDFSKNKYIVYR